MNYAENIKKKVVYSLSWLRSKIIENHLSAGQSASGATIRSLQVEETKTGGTLKGRKAIGTLETGRKPGRVPRNFNEIIQQWILDKGIPFSQIPYKRNPSDRWQPKYTAQQRGLMSLAGAIAHKIAKEGTSLYRSGNRIDIFTNPNEEAIKMIKEDLIGIFKIEALKNEHNN